MRQRTASVDIRAMLQPGNARSDSRRLVHRFPLWCQAEGGAETHRSRPTQIA